MIGAPQEGAVRPAAVAGLFYPADPDDLRSNVARLLAANEGESLAETAPPKALVVPHAGYVYSGAIAGAAYRLLAPARGMISRVVLLGPSHRVAFAGMATTTARAYQTPLGAAPIDRAWLERAAGAPQFGFLDEAHEGEHCLETQLPFLQVSLGAFTLAPIICGEASGDEVADLLERLWGGPETLVVVSSDLSHYHDYRTCVALDLATCAAIERLDAAQLGQEQACGATPVNGLLTLARRRGLRVKTLDLRNSGDTAGPRDRVVGYGAWGFWEPEAAMQSDHAYVRDHGATMNDIARRAICGETPTPEDQLPAALQEARACFVTLHKAGELRGCCGSVAARRPLAEDIRGNAHRAAFEDCRFEPLEPSEWDDITLTVTLLSPLSPLSFANEAELLAQIQPHRDGLVIEDGGRGALFLPAVWGMLPRKEEFLRSLKAKAGLSRDHWSSEFHASRFFAAQTAAERLRRA